jgi:hypothetical protein
MNSKTFLGGALIVLTACLAGGGFYAVRMSKSEPLDPATLCPRKGTGVATLIIIDRTDPLTSADQLRTRDLIEKERAAARRGDRIVVKLLRQEAGTSNVVLDTIVDLCNPGEEANPFFENPKRVAARYRGAFLQPIDAALVSVAGQTSAPASPIARSIQSSIDELAEPSKTLRLILISDLMEHGPNASAYNGTLTDGALRRVITPRTGAKSQEASIAILLLPRPRHSAKQTAALKVWQAFFKNISGQEPSVIDPNRPTRSN